MSGGNGEEKNHVILADCWYEKMKILLVLGQFNRQKYDELTNQAWNIARSLAAAGKQCVIAAGRSDGEAAMEAVGNVQIRRFSQQTNSGWSKIWRKKLLSDSSTEVLPGLEPFLEKNQFDLVHIMCSGRLCVQAAGLAASRNVPYIVNCRGEDFRIVDLLSGGTNNTGVLSPFQGVLRSYGEALEHAAGVFCSDHTLRRQLAARLGDRTVFYWQPGVDCEWFARPAAVDFRQFYQLPKSRHIILSVGRVCRNRNQKMLLDILSVLRNKNINCHLVVSGWIAEADYMEEFKAEIAALKLDDFVTCIPGFPPGDEFFKASYQAASLVLLPARYDVGGAAVLEAWSAGVPVVVSPVGCGGELVVDGENGRVAPPGEFQQWINCCCELLDERNRSQLEKMRSNGRNAARSLNWEKRLDMLLEFYQNCIKENIK